MDRSCLCSPSENLSLLIEEFISSICHYVSLTTCHLKSYSLKRTFLAISFIFSLLALQILFDLFLSYLLIWKVGILLLILHVGRLSRL